MNGDEANAQQTTFELRFSSREQSPEVEASFAKIQQMYENLAGSLDSRLLFAGTEVSIDSYPFKDGCFRV